MRIVDTLIVFRILKMLTTSWEKFDAYKLGLIDKKGMRIKDKKAESKQEKASFTLLHRLVFNLKRMQTCRNFYLANQSFAWKESGNAQISIFCGIYSNICS